MRLPRHAAVLTRRFAYSDTVGYPTLWDNSRRGHEALLCVAAFVFRKRTQFHLFAFVRLYAAYVYEGLCAARQLSARNELS